MYEYLMTMLAFTVPFLVTSIHKRRIKSYIRALALLFVFGVVWDSISVAVFHLWYWNVNSLIGVWIGYLPLEEYLFIILVPIAVLEVFFLMQRKLSFRKR